MSDTNATPKKMADNTSAEEAVADESVVDDSPVASESEVVVGEVEPTATTSDVAEVTTAEPAADSAATGEVVVDSAATGEVIGAPVQTVYVTAPTPPKPKGNRAMGTLLAVVATIVFAAVYAGVAALLFMFGSLSGLTGAITSFLTSPVFYVPVLAFLVMMIVWALLANRASWWSWVIGSVIIALVTYFASIGILLLLSGGFGLTASQGTNYFLALAVHPALIAAGLIARECAIWFGAAISKRGRKVRERNYAAWQTFENEEAQKRAEFGGAAAS